MVRRAAHVERAPLKVGFPGGEIEPGESQAQAVIREAVEELGVEVSPLECVWRCEPLDRPWVLWGWVAELLSNVITPNPREIAEVLWLTAEQGATHPDGLTTNAPFFAALANYRRPCDTPPHGHR